MDEPLRIAIGREEEGWGAACIEHPDFVLLAPTREALMAGLEAALEGYCGEPVAYWIINAHLIADQ